MCVGVDPRNGTVDEPLRATLHREVRRQPDCILGHHSATYTADVLGCSLTALTLSGNVFVGKQHLEFAVYLPLAFSVVGVLPFLVLVLLFNASLPVNTLKIPASSLSEVSEAVCDVSSGRKSIQTQNNLRLEVNLQT